MASAHDSTVAGMRLLLDVELVLRHAAPDHPWWVDGPDAHVLGEVLGAVERAGLWFDFQHAGPSGRKTLDRFDSRAALIEDSRAWSDRSYVLRATGDEREGETSLELSLGADALRLQLDVATEEVLRRGAAMLDAMVDLVAGVREQLGDRLRVGLESCVRPLRLEYPRVRPPRHHSAWNLGSVIDYADRDSFREREREIPDEPITADLEKAARAPMPPGTRREERGELVIFRWLLGPVDEPAVAAACTTQERWIAETFRPPPLSGWNDAGDEAVVTGETEKHPPLTFLDLTMGHGYKAVAARSDGTVDPDALAEVASWIEAGQLPDGTALDGVTLIVPSRQAALNLWPRAEEIGVARVVYIDSDRHLWDPVPAGDWLVP